MRKNVFDLTLSVLLLLSLLTSCLKSDWEERQNEEADRLAKNIETLRNQGLDIKTSEVMGYDMYYLFLGSDPNTGPKPSINDYIIIDYARKDLDGNVIFTNMSSLAGSWDPYNDYPDTYSHYLFVPLKMIFGYNTPGFNYGVSLMEEGDTARFYIPSTLAYGDFVTIVDEVILYKIITNISAYDSLQVAGYRAEHSIDSSMYLADGDIFYWESTHGNDAIEITASDSLIIRFKASFFQEDHLIAFDSNWESATGIAVPASRIKAEGYTPKGFAPFTKGLAAAFDTLTVGTQATLIVPYLHGYGASGLIYSAPQYPIVPPYTSLVYDIEVLDVM
jgi:hypothetical protein